MCLLCRGGDVVERLFPPQFYYHKKQTTVKIEAKNIDSQKSSRLEILTTKKLGTICAYGEQEISPLKLKQFLVASEQALTLMFQPLFLKE